MSDGEFDDLKGDEENVDIPEEEIGDVEEEDEEDDGSEEEDMM